METEQRIFQAKRVIRSLILKRAKRGPRIHQYAAQENVNRLRALEGICRDCMNLDLEFVQRDGKDMVMLGCKEDHLIVDLYENTPLGQKASCPDFYPRSDISLNGVK